MTQWGASFDCQVDLSKAKRVEEQSGVDSRGGGRILPSRASVLNRQEVEHNLDQLKVAWPRGPGILCPGSLPFVGASHHMCPELLILNSVES